MDKQTTEPTDYDERFWFDHNDLPGDEQLALWRDLSAAASPGPWLAFNANEHLDLVGDNWDIADDPDWTVTTHCVNVSRMTGAWDDYPFIAAARTAVPALLRLIAKQRDEIAELRAAQTARIAELERGLSLALEQMELDGLACSCEGERCRYCLARDALSGGNVDGAGAVGGSGA